MEIIAKNTEQEEAIKKGIEFIEHGNPKEWFIIGGKAGTGKTTIAQAILKDYFGKKTILISALSHKAKLVITEKIVSVLGKKKLISKSVAGALGMNMDQETGRFVVSTSEIDIPAIKRARIIIIDEASMINEECHQLIMTEKSPQAKVIYLGDIRQLPPIRENQSQFTDKPSPVFYGTNYAILSERIRQGEESPILPFADYFGDNSRLIHPVLNPAPAEKRNCIINDKGAIVFSDNIYDVIEMAIPLYKLAVERKDMNIVKTVTYRNETRKAINNLVREHVFDGQSSEEYLPGDLLMFQDNHDMKDFDEPISNSYEIQIISATKKEEKYKVWEIEFLYEEKPAFIEVLQECDKKRHAQDVMILFEKAKDLPKRSEPRREALAKAWGLKKKYAPVDYAYAITSHKSQGSTYNTVIVDERDIMSVSLTSNKSKSQSMYTALTRSSCTCIVVDGQRTGDKVLEAIEYSLLSLNDEK